MAASFFEVFPVLKLNKGMTDLLEEATVEKVTASQARNRIRVYLCSPRLISYEEVRKLENQIRGQLFENTDVHVDIIDRYELSEQYTPERLMSIYFDSFEAELKDSSDLEANIFHKAKKEFTDAQRMVLTVEDNFITASKIECIRDKLLKIFQERFGYYVDISVEYVRERKSRQAEYAEETFQREVETIVKNYAEAEAAVKQKEEKIAEQQKPARDFKKENTYVKKKIIDPDIFYGRPLQGMRRRFQKSMTKSRGDCPR
ncbi:MAG: PolC-type DNA polymerase III N-terminal domain-containing protein [Frisingicoccus sp.]